LSIYNLKNYISLCFLKMYWNKISSHSNIITLTHKPEEDCQAFFLEEERSFVSIRIRRWCYSSETLTKNTFDLNPFSFFVVVEKRVRCVSPHPSTIPASRRGTSWEIVSSRPRPTTSPCSGREQTQAIRRISWNSPHPTFR
jgi:hypothetical protein